MFQEYMEKAREIAPDPKNDAYFALALKLKVPIWTHDKNFKEKQAIIEIVTTKDLLLMNL
ncbi:MAG TPA: PIN domain-containing protein [Candidatus Lokiarchaeia archaeon]|nr:PIN domain-containing protein [Candidatus Lokiarchaeia archaeon]